MDGVYSTYSLLHIAAKLLTYSPHSSAWGPSYHGGPQADRPERAVNPVHH